MRNNFSLVLSQFDAATDNSLKKDTSQIGEKSEKHEKPEKKKKGFMDKIKESFEDRE